MFEVFMMIGFASIVMGLGIMEFTFLKWLFRQDEFWVFGTAFCMIIGCDCMMIGALSLL